jgi:hypothetical protein
MGILPAGETPMKRLMRAPVILCVCVPLAVAACTEEDADIGGDNLIACDGPSGGEVTGGVTNSAGTLVTIDPVTGARISTDSGDLLVLGVDIALRFAFPCSQAEEGGVYDLDSSLLVNDCANPDGARAALLQSTSTGGTLIIDQMNDQCLAGRFEVDFDDPDLASPDHMSGWFRENLSQ